MGEGCVDLVTFISEWKKLCPELTMQLETISGFTKFPIMEDDFGHPIQKFQVMSFQISPTCTKGKGNYAFSLPEKLES